MKIITNNPLVYQQFNEVYEIEYLENKTYLEVLNFTRDLIHENFILLTHPLSGSIKPDETPYKSILVKEGRDEFKSLMIIENSIIKASTMIKESKKKEYTEKLLKDFSVVDCDLIKSGLESYEMVLSN